MKTKIIVESRYEAQQTALNEIAAKLGVIAYRPDYHGEKGDKNTVLFYTQEDAEHNRQVDRQPVRYTRAEAADRKKYSHIEIPSEYIYRDYFWSFENTDWIGLENLDYANRGEIDLRDPRWKEILEGHIRLALAKEWQNQYVASCGGYLEMREADDVNNTLNREKIAAMKMIYGWVFLLDVNYYDKQRRRIVAGEESIYEEVDNPKDVCNFAGLYCVPTKDAELEELIRKWNADETLPKRGADVDKITDRLYKIKGIVLIWS